MSTSLVSPSFSVVIPTLNEEKCLPLLLHDLEQQSFKNFEVIHVDGNSDDDTVKIAKQFKDKLNLQTIFSDQRNVSHQRNLGGKTAQSQWTIFLDADDRIPSFFLQGIRYQLDKHPDTDVFTCWLEPDSRLLPDMAIAQSLNLSLEVNFLFKKFCAFGAMIGVRKSVFLSHSFDESVQVLEDTLFVRELSRKGFVFKVFKDPKYTFSLRRIRKDGTIKSLRTTAVLQLKRLQGEKILNDDQIYPMLGGGYYSDKSEDTFERNIRSTLSRLPKKQLQEAKKILDKLNDFLSA